MQLSKMEPISVFNFHNIKDSQGLGREEDLLS